MIFRLIEARPNEIRSQPTPIESLASRLFCNFGQLDMASITNFYQEVPK